MRLYVIGPVSGIAEHNRPAFEEARAKLKEHGYEVEIPHDTIPSDTTYPAAMRQSIGRLLEAGGVALLDSWWESPGATLERSVAEAGGIPVLTVGAWAGERP